MDPTPKPFDAIDYAHSPRRGKIHEMGLVECAVDGYCRCRRCWEKVVVERMDGAVEGVASALALSLTIWSMAQTNDFQCFVGLSFPLLAQWGAVWVDLRSFE